MAEHRHKRETNAFRFPRAAVVAAPVATLATLAAVTVGVVGSTPAATPDLVAQAGIGGAVERDAVVSRSGERPGDARSLARVVKRRQASYERRFSQEQKAAEEGLIRAAERAGTRRWTTAPLDVWTATGPDARTVGELDEGEKVLVTGRKADGRVELVLQGRLRWVTAGYLSDEKPDELVAGLGGSCDNGTSVPSGVSPNIVKVHQAVCAAFPEITVYGTFRGDGEHSQGLAVDIMVSGARGQQVADFVRAHYSELGVSYVIYAQRIWSVERGGEGWRGMSNRGSATANHYDHVHVTTY